jgi:hypothetical protein
VVPSVKHQRFKDLVEIRWWRGLDLNQRRRAPTDLQSVPFSRSGTPPTRERDFSHLPAVVNEGYACAAE